MAWNWNYTTQQYEWIEQNPQIGGGVPGTAPTGLTPPAPPPSYGATDVYRSWTSPTQQPVTNLPVSQPNASLQPQARITGSQLPINNAGRGLGLPNVAPQRGRNPSLESAAPMPANPTANKGIPYTGTPVTPTSTGYQLYPRPTTTGATQTAGQGAQYFSGTAPMYNPIPVGSGQEPNNFITSSGGINYGQIPGILNNLYSMAWPAAYNSTVNQQELLSSLGTLLGGLDPSAQSYMNQFLPTQMGTLNQLATEGLPGYQDILAQGGTQGALASRLLGGTGAGQYGLTDLLDQIMTGGLPNQQAIEQLTGQQIGYGQEQQGALANLISQLQGGGTVQSPQQQQLLNTIMGFTQGAGITPEYVQAMRKTVLEPSQEALLGNINQMAGGGALLTSPAYQELLRRNEEQFNNQLIGQGFQNLQGFMGLGQQGTGQGFGQGTTLANLLQNAGQTGIAQALQGFGAIPSAVAPYTNLAGQLATNLGSQQLQNWQGANQGMLQNLSTIQNLASQPNTQLLGNLQQLLSGQQTYGTNQQNIMQSLLNQMFANKWADMAAGEGNWDWIGPAIAAALNTISSGGSDSEGASNPQTGQGSGNLESY